MLDTERTKEGSGRRRVGRNAWGGDREEKNTPLVGDVSAYRDYCSGGGGESRPKRRE